MARETYTVSEVAKLTGVTVRTLHHYDEIGLLSPRRRTDAGYRLYGRDDLARLHEILIYRGFGLALDAIRELLAAPAAARRRALAAQRERLAREIDETGRMLRAIDDALTTLEGGPDMDPKTLFDGFDPSAYEDEARRRWGGTEAYAESSRRLKSYGESEIAAMQQEAGAILAALAAALAAGEDAQSATATALAERYRTHIDRWFYPCDHAHHERLADLYETDERFAATYEKVAPGLARYLVAAIRANGKRAKSAP